MRREVPFYKGCGQVQLTTGKGIVMLKTCN